MITSLQNDTFDLCMYAALSSALDCGYDFTPLYSVRQCIVLPTGHALECRSSLELTDLYGMELVILAPGILRDHDEFRQLVLQQNLPIHLLEVQNYDFETRADCFKRRLPFLGMEALSHQYAPLACIPGNWEIRAEIGLLSKIPSWPDLQLLITEMKKVFVL